MHVHEHVHVNIGVPPPSRWTCACARPGERLQTTALHPGVSHACWVVVWSHAVSGSCDTAAAAHRNVLLEDDDRWELHRHRGRADRYVVAGEHDRHTPDDRLHSVLPRPQREWYVGERRVVGILRGAWRVAWRQQPRTGSSPDGGTRAFGTLHSTHGTHEDKRRVESSRNPRLHFLIVGGGSEWVLHRWADTVLESPWLHSHRRLAPLIFQFAM